ncbi:hypothetical protein V6Z11_D11G333200 [Gossypium hirsutum]
MDEGMQPKRMQKVFNSIMGRLCRVPPHSSAVAWVKRSIEEI